MQRVTYLPKEAEQLVEQLVKWLNPSAKLRLAEQLDRETRRARWEPLVMKMRQRFAKRPLSPREIRRLCEPRRCRTAERVLEGDA